MRLKLTLTCPPNARLAFDHHFALRAAIYRIIERADSEYSQWLHENGFSATGKKTFKLFSFDLLRGQPFWLDNERKQIVFSSGVVEWTLGFYVEKQVETFVEGLFKNQVLEVVAEATKVVFTVQNVEVLASPTFSSSATFRCESGICLTEKSDTDRYEQFRSPESVGYKQLFFNSLAAKVQAATGKMTPQYSDDIFDFKVLNTPKKWSTVVPQDAGEKPIRTIGYKFDFHITAPVEWLRVGFDGGFGKSASGGFGFVRVLR